MHLVGTLLMLHNYTSGNAQGSPCPHDMKASHVIFFIDFQYLEKILDNGFFMRDFGTKQENVQLDDAKGYNSYFITTIFS